MGGTSLLIMVGVDLDTMSQIEAHLRMHHHDGIVRKGKIRSRYL
jgi:preprotein translocase subunit SecY